ncbi:MAG: hypothetical protein HWE30_07325 [Methylocystaceae bacterium]|nr:hypothetical protein [Methylocystaceae bacterium]
MALSIFENISKTNTSEGVLPPTTEIVKASAFGAVLGMATSGLGNYARVKTGEIESKEAVAETLSDGAKSAASMAVATVAAHLVRRHPVVGLAALAAVGAGAFLMIKKANEEAAQQEAAVQPTSTEEVADGPTIEVDADEVVVEETKPRRHRARKGQEPTEDIE